MLVGAPLAVAVSGVLCPRHDCSLSAYRSAVPLAGVLVVLGRCSAIPVKPPLQEAQRLVQDLRLVGPLVASKGQLGCRFRRDRLLLLVRELQDLLQVRDFPGRRSHAHTDVAVDLLLLSLRDEDVGDLAIRTICPPRGHHLLAAGVGTLSLRHASE